MSDQSYIDKFCSTYNPGYLSGFSEENKKFILTQSEDMLRKYFEDKISTGFVGLAYIIKNNLIPPNYTRVSHIYPCANLTFLRSEKYGMSIYTFGDIHNRNVKCLGESVDKFILQQIQVARDFVDLFIELPYTGRNSKHPSSRVYYTYMGYLQDLCFNGKCEMYPHLRFHYSDLRILGISPLIDLALKLENPSYILNEFDIIPLTEILEDKNTLWSHLYSLINNTKIITQIEATDPEILPALYTSIEMWFDEINFDVLKELDINPSQSNILLLRLQLVLFGSILMDIYTLARIFRSYAETTNRFSDKARNVVVYAGNFHTQRYNQFLMDIGFKVVSESSSDNLCLNISKFKQPFF